MFPFVTVIAVDLDDLFTKVRVKKTKLNNKKDTTVFFNNYFISYFVTKMNLIGQKCKNKE